MKEIIDEDEDGMDDTWENRHFGDLSQDGTGDYDNDGLSDLWEYQNNTDPTVSNQKGDINGDGSINLDDLILALRYVPE